MQQTKNFFLNHTLPQQQVKNGQINLYKLTKDHKCLEISKSLLNQNRNGIFLYQIITINKIRLQTLFKINSTTKKLPVATW